MREPRVSFEAFVDSEMSRLLRLAYALTGSPHDAWDLTQDTLVKVGTRWSRLRRAESGAQYARTTMVRLNVSRWRRRQREVLGDPPDQLAVDGAEQVPVLSPAVHEALMSLGLRQRTTVVLRHLYDMTLQEIANDMRCSVGTVKSQLARGQQNLRQALETSEGYSTPTPPKEKHHE